MKRDFYWISTTKMTFLLVADDGMVNTQKSAHIINAFAKQPAKNVFEWLRKGTIAGARVHEGVRWKKLKTVHFPSQKALW